MSRDDTLAFWIAAPGRGELRREAMPTPSAQEASVRTLYSGVSRGTEALVFGGNVPEAEYQRMRAPFQAGQFPAPVKYGYTSVGQVMQGPAELAGKDVFCLYPHQQHYVVPMRCAVCAARIGACRRAPYSPRIWRRRSMGCGIRAPRPATASR